MPGLAVLYYVLLNFLERLSCALKRSCREIFVVLRRLYANSLISGFDKTTRAWNVFQNSSVRKLCSNNIPWDSGLETAATQISVRRWGGLCTLVVRGEFVYTRHCACTYTYFLIRLILFRLDWKYSIYIYIYKKKSVTKLVVTSWGRRDGIAFLL